MKKWKLYQFALFAVLCILINLGGKELTTQLSLPLWLDSMGTVLCAYIAGPVCGSLVGVTSNLIYSMQVHMSFVYGLTSIVMGVIVGLEAKKKKLDTVFGTMTVSAMTAFASLAVSLPLNLLLYDGSTGNLWGDGVIGFLLENGFPRILSCGIGQFYLEFLDKLITLALLYLIIKSVRRIRRRRHHGKDLAETAGKTASILLALMLCGHLLPLPAEAEGNFFDYTDYVQTIYGSSNGLPCGEANDIAQTNDGILWIGTYNGLYRYNGSEFRWMNYKSVRNVNCLYVDEEGRLWIGSNDNGLSIAINDEISATLDPTNGLPSYSVRSIIQSSDGDYYIGTSGSMQVLSLSSGLRKKNTLWEITYTDDAAADAKGHVAAVTNSGMLFLLRQGEIINSRQFAKGSEVFSACAFAPSGHLLAGTSAGNIYIYDISDGWFTQVETRKCEGLSSIKDLYFMEDGNLFITADNGVGFANPAGDFYMINTNDFNNSIDNMLIDYQGNLWFTSSRLGLLRMASSSFRDLYSSTGMEKRVVNAVVRWQQNYCIGTDKGLDMMDDSCKNQVKNALTESLSGVRIRCMMVDSADHLWICTYGKGVLEIDPDGTEHWYTSENGSVGNRTRGAIELNDGTVLVAGDLGISYIRDHEMLHTIRRIDSQINSMVLTLTEMPDGSILAGTDGNGLAVIRDGQVERMLTRGDGLTSEVILRTMYDKKGEGVFIVTSNSLCYMEKDGSIRQLDNFPYFNNYNLYIKDDDTLFVMSSAGIYVINRVQLLSGRTDLEFDLLDSRRGLNGSITANSWNWVDDNGDLFLPCDTGVFILNTEHYAEGAHSYRMTVPTLHLNTVPISNEYGSSIVLNRDVSKLEMYPEVINYTIQDPYVGYWLEGFDTTWTIQLLSAMNNIVYTNLPVGEYTFHLAVFDYNQIDILSERTYTIVKAREIYDNRWFIIYLLAVPMAAVAWLTWYIMRTQVQRTLDIQKRELALAQQQVQMGNETIFAIAKAVDAKDERTSQHSLRVSQYSVMIAQALGLSEEDCESIRRTALMHDIGKIGIPDAILNKPARLTDEEYEIMKSHTVRGAEILKDFTLIDHVVEGAQYHHERFDGRGYPAGLKGTDIPLFARIIGVADAFDAMTANRVYRKQMDMDYVLSEIRKGRGTQFDPQMADILLQLIDEGKIDVNKIYNIPKKTAQDEGKKEGGA